MNRIKRLLVVGLALAGLAFVGIGCDKFGSSGGDYAVNNDGKGTSKEPIKEPENQSPKLVGAIVTGHFRLTNGDVIIVSKNGVANKVLNQQKDGDTWRIEGTQLIIENEQSIFRIAGDKITLESKDGSVTVLAEAEK
jgi:hypothetical protein